MLHGVYVPPCVCSPVSILYAHEDFRFLQIRLQIRFCEKLETSSIFGPPAGRQCMQQKMGVSLVGPYLRRAVCCIVHASPFCPNHYTRGGAVRPVNP